MTIAEKSYKRVKNLYDQGVMSAQKEEDLPEDQGNIDVADTSPEAMEEDDYIPDIEALKDFF